MERVKKSFKKYLKNKNIYFPFGNREERSRFVSRIYKNFLKNSVLDVGCSEGSLKIYITKDVKYVGIDISGKPDIIIDLEKDKLKIFEDNSFYTIVCTEVLEHLENIHEIFDELCRVSKRYIIISLPNNWVLFKFSLLSGKNVQKFYGLPIEIPSDRHKWFFNYDQAFNFIRERGLRNNFIIRNKFSIPIVFNTLKLQILNLFFKIYYGNQFGFNNLHYSSIWVLLEKKL